MLDYGIENRLRATESPGRPQAGVSAVPILFSITLFVSSFLLFLVQPMFARMVLPLLGGTPAVWNTCMVFFQAALLAGYAYSHALQNWLGTRSGLIVHLLFLLLPFLILPIAIPLNWMPPHNSNPVFWLLALLAVVVGLPFFVISTTAPLVQRWFAATKHRAAGDPYFLYGASNLGSMAALLAYPLILEPFSSLHSHSQLWTIGYGVFVILMAGCATCVWGDLPSALRLVNDDLRSSKSAYQAVMRDHQPTVRALSLTRCFRWVLLAFVPSSLMLSVTGYLTTDIAAIPLLWIVPLSIYLFSFILVFARRPIVPAWLASAAMPRFVLIMIFVLISEATQPIGLLLFLHLLTFFVVAVACHGELAHDRPGPQNLTAFYLLLSLGGVMGGLFNALLAPLIFPGLVEYPLVLILAGLLRIPVSGSFNITRGGEWRRRLSWSTMRARVLEAAPALLLALLTAVFVLVLQARGLKPGMLSIGLMFGPAVLVCYLWIHRPLRFAAGIAAIMAASLCYDGVRGSVLFRERSFFGIHRVTLSPDRKTRELFHGYTVHGRQDPLHPKEPLSYYFRGGPIGQLFSAFSGSAAKPEVAIVGLGTGALAAYGQSGQHFTFYEIDPSVVRIAKDRKLFTYLADSSAAIDIVTGDARLTLKDAPDGHYGILVIDAFSSDSIPVHLLTKEALRLYLSKLASDGILAFHVSNRYLHLEPVLAALARDAGLFCLDQEIKELPAEDLQDGKDASEWVILARHLSDFGPLVKDIEGSGPEGSNPRWHKAKASPDVPVWTDDFSNLFRVFRWD
jgi:hypothetical protein